MVLGLYEAGLEPALPKIPASFVSLVHILSVELPDTFHEMGASARFMGSHQQVDVVAHQAVGVQDATRTRKHSRKVENVERPVLFTKKTRTAVVAALNRVDGDSGKHDSRVSRHTLSTEAAVLPLTNKRGLSLIQGSS